MTRQTSAEAYKYLVESGVLAKSNSRVYEYLYFNGPTTQKKTERALNDKTYTMRPRFVQLERMGLIQIVGETVCEETGKKNLIWDVTSRVLPLKEKRKTQKEIIKEIISDIEKYGKKLPSLYRPELREIYYKLKKL